MRITSDLHEDILVVGFLGELDEHAADLVREDFENAIDDSRVGRVVLDMAGLRFMDSTGIGVIIGRFKKLKARGIPVAVMNPNTTVDKIFRLTGLYDLMPKIG